jgi:hypothetical protein
VTLVWIAWAGLACYRFACWLKRRTETWEERGRARSQAEMSAAQHVALKPAEQQFADTVHAFAVEWHETGEQPFVPVVRRKPRTVVHKRVERRRLAKERIETRRTMAALERDLAFELDPLEAPLAGQLAEAPTYSSVKPFEPLQFESFTESWTRDRLAQILSAGAPK